MKLEIKYSNKVSEEHTKFKFDYIWRSKYTESKINLVIGVFFSVLGGILLYEGQKFGYFIFPLGVYFLFQSIFFLISYFKSKRETQNNLKEHIQKFPDEVLTLEFFEEFLKYEDGRLKSEIKWELFSNYKLVDEHLILFFKKSENPSIVISKKILVN